MSTDRRWTLDQYLKSGQATDVVLVKIEHPDGDVHVWDGLGTLDVDVGDGVVPFKGLGRIGSVTIAASDTEVQVQDVVFTLAGVDPEYLAYLDATVKGNRAWVWKAFLGPDFTVQYRIQVSESELDQPTYAIEPNGTATVSIAANGGFYFLDVQSAAVWDVEEQNHYLIGLSLDPTSDTGFDLMSELKNTQIAWERD